MKAFRFALLLLVLPSAAEQAVSAPPRVEELRIQKVGDTTYFHVRFETPQRMLEMQDARPGPRGVGLPVSSTSPRLVSSDQKAIHLYQRPASTQAQSRRVEEVPNPPGQKAPPAPRTPVAVQGLEFVGKVREVGAAELTLLYPRASRLGRIIPGRRDRVSWEEEKVSLDLSKAKEVAIPDEAKKRREGPVGKQATDHPVRDDLEGLWAAAQVEHFANQASFVSEFGFFHFSAEATARKYHVPGVNSLGVRGVPEDRGPAAPGAPADLRELYDLTTGATAITESLAMRRMRATGLLDDGKRTADVAKLRGIDIAEHPWKKMMAGKKPADEPLAQMVPHDNYYVSFKSLRKFNELGDQLDRWGSSLQQAWQLNSRDFRLKERYEQQLCLRSTTIGRTLGPLVIKGLAITGSDAYLREGSDITLIFQVNNRDVFLAGVQGFIKEAEQKFGDALNKSKSVHNDIAIESFVTPQREVSLHRCSFDEHVIYSNSLAGLRRVLDAHKGKVKRLSESLDFQYMRTIFRADDKEEDGFAFLSDAFIRQLVGPASKIKEKRRLEALTSLHMITNGALFTAWETGKKPAAHREVIAGANLKPHEIPMPEGKPALWKESEQVAFSDAYNTLHFVTPLVELPIDKATPAEAQQYEQFRLEYLGLWRRYFDPIGVRFSLRDGQTKVDTYILPLIENSQYNELRRVSGGSGITYDSGRISSSTLFQFLIHISPGAQLRQWILGFGEAGDEPLNPFAMLAMGLGPVGKWGMVRADDSEVYAKLAALIEKSDGGEDVDTLEIARLVFELPIMVGLDIKNPLTFGAALAAARISVLNSLPGGITWEPMEMPYKGVPIVRIHATGGAIRNLIGPVGRERKEGKPFEPSIYYAMLDGGFYLTLNEKMLKDFIDEAETRKKGETKPVTVNSSLYLSPGAAKLSGILLRKYLEGQVHHQALTNLPVLEALRGCGIAPEKARQYLGYVPGSPDGSKYEFDEARGEMTNTRHGSMRKPSPQKDLAEGSPLTKLLEELLLARADLRFREDGIHTVLTLERKKAK